MLSLIELTSAIKEGNAETIARLMKENNLVIENGKIIASAKSTELLYDSWNTLQATKKRNLNSLYGALLNRGCRFHDKRLGQSTTLTGRIIAKHMDAHVNEAITGVYDHIGDAVIYGDSVRGDSIIHTDRGDISIEQLYNESCPDHAMHLPTDKTYGYASPYKVLGYDATANSAIFSEVSYVMRHLTTKHLYMVVTSNGKQIAITGDHSQMVVRDGLLIQCRPTEFLPMDKLISAGSEGEVELVGWESVTDLGATEEFVYDISIKDQDHYFFANGLLEKNTDSVYFSAWPSLKDQAEAGDITWDKDVCIELYDAIADSVNESFPVFMKQACNAPEEMGKIIKGGREIVASKGLFIKKKRYAVLVYDKEGKRLDKEGNSGKVKALGLDLKRSDTPKIVQTFLSDLLMEVLTGTVDATTKDIIIEKVLAFKKSFNARPSWEKGTPKRVNKLTYYANEAETKGKVTMPGHVRGAINWNTLRRLHDDNTSPEIIDGMKTIVCKLKDNQIGYSSIGYPIDCAHLPQWFKDLPFDDDLMEATIVDKKVENLLGILEWSIAESTDIRSTFNDLFSFN